MSFGNSGKGNFGTRANHSSKRAGMSSAPINSPSNTAKLPAVKSAHNSKSANSNISIGAAKSAMGAGANGMNRAGSNAAPRSKPL